jgi:hypothetical protein
MAADLLTGSEAILTIDTRTELHWPAHDTQRDARPSSSPTTAIGGSVAISVFKRAICFVAVLLFGAAAGATPLLTFDMRAVSVNTFGTITIPSDVKNVTAPTGSVVTLNLYAALANANSNHADDGFLLTHGSFKSSVGGLTGDLRGDTGTTPTLTNNTANFNQGVAQSGFRVDLDGDTDADVGSLANIGSPSPTPWFIASSGTGTFFGTGTGAGNTEFLIGTTTFTIGGSSGSTQINYVPRVKTDGFTSEQATDQFTVDGTPFGVRGDDPSLSVGASVTVSVPEPNSTEFIATMGLLTLLGQRRRRTARQ